MCERYDLIINFLLCCFVLGENTLYLRHNVRWIFNAIKTNAVITPDPCDDKKSCLLHESDGKSYLAEVFVSSTLPNVGIGIFIYFRILLQNITNLFLIISLFITGLLFTDTRHNDVGSRKCLQCWSYLF